MLTIINNLNICKIKSLLAERDRPPSSPITWRGQGYCQAVKSSLPGKSDIEILFFPIFPGAACHPHVCCSCWLWTIFLLTRVLLLFLLSSIEAA